MNPILNDPLVRKYFGCATCEVCNTNGVLCSAKALRVLDAMCAPLKDGQRILLLNPGRNAREQEAVNDFPEQIHAMILAIPSEHQEPDYEKELAEKRSSVVTDPWDYRLDVLIDLARKAERQKMEREAKR